MKLACWLTASLMLTLAAIGSRAVGGEVSAPSITEPKAPAPTVAPAATTPSTFPSFAPTVPAPLATSSTPTPAAVIVFKGEVDDYSRDALFKRFDQAKAAGAKVIILRLNTPGGLVSVSIRREPGPTTTALENVPAFHLGSAVVDVEDRSPVAAD